MSRRAPSSRDSRVHFVYAARVTCPLLMLNPIDAEPQFLSTAVDRLRRPAGESQVGRGTHHVAAPTAGLLCFDGAQDSGDAVCVMCL